MADDYARFLGYQSPFSDDPRMTAHFSWLHHRGGFEQACRIENEDRRAERSAYHLEQLLKCVTADNPPYARTVAAPERTPRRYAVARQAGGFCAAHPVWLALIVAWVAWGIWIFTGGGG